MELSSIAELIEHNGEFCPTGNNLPILLQSSENIWFIKSGSVDIFSVQNYDQDVQGARNYLFTISSGNILIGLEGDEFTSRSLIAVGNIDTCLYKYRVNDLLCKVQDNNLVQVFSYLIDKWILSLTAGAARDSSLKYDLVIEPSNHITIPENQKIRACKGVLWIKITAPSITFLDNELDQFEDIIYFPLTENSWCLSLKTFHTVTAATYNLIQDQKFSDYLKYFHRQFLLLEELNSRMQMVDDFVRNKEKTLIMREIDKVANYNIAGILNENIKDHHEFTRNDSLLQACKIVCNHIGIHLTEPHKDNRTNEISLDDISRSSKFQYRKISLSENWWKNDSGSLLAFTKDTRQPAVLLSNHYGKYKIIIPSEKIDTRITPDLAGRIDEHAYSFYKPFPYEKITPTKFIKFIFDSCKKELGLLVIAGSVGGLLTVLIPFLTGIIVDTVIPQSDKYKLFGFGLAIIFSVFAIIFAQIIRSISYIRLDTKLDYLIHSALWDKLINLPVSFFKKFSSGELASKANSLAYFKQILAFSVINIVIYDIFLIFNLMLLFYYNLLLGFLSLILFAVYVLIVIRIGIKIKRKSSIVIQHENIITSLVNQVLNSIAKIRIAGVENLAFKLWTDKYSIKQKENISVKNNSKKILVLNSVFPALAIIFILFLLTSERYSYLSAGVLISFFTAYKVFLLSLVQIANASVLFFSAVPLYENSKEILYSLPDYVKEEAYLKEIKGEIEVSHVWFRYPGEQKYVLRDVSMSVKPGEFIAIVGASGSGKSTMLRLLLGFEVPEKGAVYYDKNNINSISKSGLRRQIGTVLQNSRLFPGNIYSNIAGVKNLTISQVNDIARTVGLDEDLRTMPMGLFTVINEGLSTLSGGQRQKILIAKALISNPSVILFDEATSALDNEAQKVISDNISKIQATRIIVAHRLSTIKDAGKIYLLEKGSIAECGSFDELMIKNGKFARLINRQLTKV